MLLDMLGLAHAPRVLSAVARVGGQARFTAIRNAAPGLGDSQVSRALKELNKRGLVVGRPGQDRAMAYAVTKAGREVLDILSDFHALVHARSSNVAKAADAELEAILAA